MAMATRRPNTPALETAQPVAVFGPSPMTAGLVMLVARAQVSGVARCERGSDPWLAGLWSGCSDLAGYAGPWVRVPCVQGAGCAGLKDPDLPCRHKVIASSAGERACIWVAASVPAQLSYLASDILCRASRHPC